MGLLNRKTGAGASAQKAEKEITIANRLGLHARPAALFVKVASRFRAEVWVKKEGEEVNGKSIMGLMMLAAGQGSVIMLEAEGPEGPEAIDALVALVESGFGEEN